MANRGDPLHDVLDGYARFLREKNLALDKHQPYLVRCVREFLLFARTHAGYSFEQTLDLFLAEVGGRVGTKPWQLQQASRGIKGSGVFTSALAWRITGDCEDGMSIQPG